MESQQISSIRINNETDLLQARHSVREAAVKMGFNIVDQTRLVTAVSEITRNAYLYARGGAMVLNSVEEEGRKGLLVTVTDNGPGIPDIEQAMTDGYSTRGGLGNGLGGTKRLVNNFKITSVAGEGTEVEILRWKS